MTADEVLEEFLLDPCCIDCPASDCINERRMAEEIVRLRDALATVSGERDALVNLVEVLRQYYQRKANDDELYAAFCAWRENPFSTITTPHA